jgi:hypothetical protein
MPVLSLLLTGLMLSSTGSTVDGTTFDPRIEACGVHVEVSEMALLRPFIEASPDLAGSFRIAVTKRSRSGTAITSQSSRFTGGSLGDVSLAVDQPSRIDIDMTVTAPDGTALCGVDTNIEFDEPPIRL